MFMLGAVLFLLAVLFFVFVWSDRNRLLRQRDLLENDRHRMAEQKVELEIWNTELQVWYESLEEQQRQLEQDREELRMLTASKQPPPTSPSEDTAPPTKSHTRHRNPFKGKNIKDDIGSK